MQSLVQRMEVWEDSEVHGPQCALPRPDRQAWTMQTQEVDGGDAIRNCAEPLVTMLLREQCDEVGWHSAGMSMMQRLSSSRSRPAPPRGVHLLPHWSSMPRQLAVQGQRVGVESEGSRPALAQQRGLPHARQRSAPQTDGVAALARPSAVQDPCAGYPTERIEAQQTWIQEICRTRSSDACLSVFARLGTTHWIGSCTM